MTASDPTLVLPPLHGTYCIFVQAKHHKWYYGPNFGLLDFTVGKGEQRPDITSEYTREMPNDTIATDATRCAYAYSMGSSLLRGKLTTVSYLLAQKRTKTKTKKS